LAQSVIELGPEQNSGPTQGTAHSLPRLQKCGLASALLCGTALAKAWAAICSAHLGLNWPKTTSTINLDRTTERDSQMKQKPDAGALPQSLAAFFSFLS
jgi:hypothetical protein